MLSKLLPGRAIPVALVLGLATFALFFPLRKCDFLNYDDSIYVTQNSLVKSGISWASCKKALTACYGCNWHPVTTISHMLDRQMHGLNPAGHHLTNIFLHAINAMLLLWLLRLMTGSLWRSAIVAALFAWHPLHVESVAWVAERKDLLSTFFGFLCLIAYAKFAKSQQSRGWHAVFYLIALTFFVLGLMSKPMLVTLPFVMLLLDIWPLTRFPLNAGIRSWWKPAVRLVAEKIPFFGLSLLSCLVTLWVQGRGGALESLEEIPFGARVANTAVAYMKYLGLAAFPAGLAVPYPHPVHFPLAQVAGGFLLIVACTVAAIWQLRRRPYFAVGWFWFLGMLVPVIGLVQVGDQSMADRYTYVPLIGIFIAVVWGMAEFAGQNALRRTLVAGCAVAVLVACAITTHAQLRYWKNSETLFRHALEVTRENPWAEINYGCALYDEHQFADARAHFLKAQQMKPNTALPLLNLGKVCEAQGDYAQALDYYARAFSLSPRNADICVAYAYVLERVGRDSEALELYKAGESVKPENPVLQFNYGVVLSKRGDLDDAAQHLRHALRLDPALFQARIELGNIAARNGNIDEAIATFRDCVARQPTNDTAHLNLGLLLEQTGKAPDALQHYREAVRVQPDSARGRSYLGVLLAKEGQPAEAELQFRRFAELEPTNTDAFYNLGNALFFQKKFSEAAIIYSNAVRLSPRDVEANYKLADCLVRERKFPEAVGALRGTLQINPSHVAAMIDLAWVRAASPDAASRNGEEALRLARRACALTAFGDVNARGALDAALAENGKFPEAIEAVAKTRALAIEAAKAELAEAAAKREALYRDGKPFRLP